MSVGRPRLLLGLLGAGLLLAAADAYAVATLLPGMLADAGLPIDHFEQATPIITGFLAGYVAALPLVGSLSDRWGRLPVYLGALGVFAIGSLVTAWSPELRWMVVGRAVQGIGGGAMVPVTLGLAADLFEGAARDRWIGAVSGLQEAGSVIGPAYGAALASVGGALGWRFVFLLNVPIAVAVALVAFNLGRTRAEGGARLAAGDPPDLGASPLPGLERPAAGGGDLVAAGTLGLGLAAVTVALYPDDPSRSPVDRYFLPFAVLGLGLLAIYVSRQARALSPLVPARVLRSPAFAGSLATNLLVGAGLMAVLVDVPVFARGVFGVDQGRAGLLLTSFLAGVPLGAVAGGWLGPRAGRRVVACAGLAGATGGFLLLAEWNAKTLTQRLGGLPLPDVELAALGLAFGLVIAPVAAAALDAAEHREHGLISSLVVASRTIGMLLALSLLTAFGLYRFRQLLAAEPAPPDTASLHDRLKALETGVTNALVLEYHDIFRLAALLCAVGALCAGLTLHRRTAAATAPG